ncbi:hypothetical protein T11_5305 [Trichinella zimbabwensis]|uniref:Uncharacterized protein n=1 Tax=Trichinella zimbabwensis TaxID=268475 RepID=A0A0V1FSI8_9BILA|nr:hypothetical protein T11_5305 [Trichinella zimbabwensis]
MSWMSEEVFIFKHRWSLYDIITDALKSCDSQNRKAVLSE